MLYLNTTKVLGVQKDYYAEKSELIVHVDSLVDIRKSYLNETYKKETE